MKNQSEFERVGAEKRGGFIGTELLAFLVSNKKLWMAPILIIMLMFGGTDHVGVDRGGTVHLYAFLIAVSGILWGRSFPRSLPAAMSLLPQSGGCFSKLIPIIFSHYVQVFLR